MAADLKNDEEEYHSSSDEDYDPEKDDELDAQDEIDDAEAVEDDGEEDIEQLKKEAKSEEKEQKSGNSSDDVDVDALFAELTGQTAPKINTDCLASSSSQKEEKVYPKSTISSSSSSTPSNSTTSEAKVYPSKPETSITSSESSNGSGKKRMGLLDAAKTLSKRSKMSVLERSDRDWKDFTTEHNIKEDLESHNRGKGGYLNKMEFLSRTDNRQFEKERAFRATARKDNGL